MRPLARGLALAALLAAGCTFSDGRGFARASGELEASFAGLDPAAGRLSADGWLKTDTSFEVQVTDLTLQVREVRLTAAAAAGGTGDGTCTFDPADPPEGCTLCHSGHCHCGEDLKTYAELEAELCGGGGTAASTVVAFPLGAGLDLLQPAPVPLTTCGAACDLGRGEIDGVAVVLDHLTLHATLRDRSVADRLGGAELDVAVSWDLAGATLESTLAEPAVLDRDQPYPVRVAVALPVAAGLLDGIAWDELARDGTTVTIDAASNAAAGATLTDNLTQSPLAVTVTRDDN
jgi:hypothetical protein